MVKKGIELILDEQREKEEREKSECVVGFDCGYSRQDQEVIIGSTRMSPRWARRLRARSSGQGLFWIYTEDYAEGGAEEAFGMV